MDRRIVQRLSLGHTARVVQEDSGGIAIEAEARLCPGHEVDLVFTATSTAAGSPPRRALVWSWRLIGIGANGPRYHGYCRWM